MRLPARLLVLLIMVLVSAALAVPARGSTPNDDRPVPTGDHAKRRLPVPAASGRSGIRQVGGRTVGVHQSGRHTPMSAAGARF